MNGRNFIFGIVAIAAAGLGVFALMKRGAQTPDPAGEETTPTLVTVQTGALKLATLHRYVRGFGTIEPAPATADQPAADAPLAAASAGVVTRVNVIAGQLVKKGDVLMELNSGATTYEQAERELERLKKLFAEQNTSLKDLQDAETRLALLRVTAPLSGTVARLNVKPGQAVDLTTVVAELIDLDRLAVSAEIPAAEANEVKIGDPVEVAANPPLGTELFFVSPNVSQDNGTVLVRALLPGGGGLRPGESVSLRITTAIHSNCLAAPIESVVTDERGDNVVALVKGDEASRTPVQTGLREDGWVEIAAPEIKANDTVVTVGAYGLPDKTKIRLRTSSGDEASPASPPEAK